MKGISIIGIGIISLITFLSFHKDEMFASSSKTLFTLILTGVVIILYAVNKPWKWKDNNHDWKVAFAIGLLGQVSTVLFGLFSHFVG